MERAQRLIIAPGLMQAGVSRDNFNYVKTDFYVVHNGHVMAPTNGRLSVKNYMRDGTLVQTVVE
jgi:hypothetical protein